MSIGFFFTFVCSCLYDTKLNDIIIFMEIVHNNYQKIHLSKILFVMMIPHRVVQYKPSTWPPIALNHIQMI